MSDKMTLQDCIDLATFAHRHQYDKAGEPYINHPLRVLENVKAQGARSFVQMAAVLHDVTEDTPFTPEMLLALGVPEAAVDVVRLLDRHISYGYYNQDKLGNSLLRMNEDPLVPTKYDFPASKDEYYYLNIRKNPGALLVKLADIGDNTQPWRLDYLPAETQERLLAKYAAARKALGRR